MYLNIIVFILAFLIIFFISLFCLLKKTLVIDNLYLIIPAICIGIWAFYSLYHQEFQLYYWDCYVVYSAGKQIFINPEKLYNVPTYLYMPNFAIFLAFTLSIFPYSMAYTVLFIYNYIWGVFSIREFNKILILMRVKKKIHRFMFLMIISNGFFVYNQFWFNQTKYLLLLILLFIIRRELQFNKDEIEKDLKYYLINYSLFVLAIGMAPHFIFYLIIYMFQDIPRNEIFKKENIKKYSIVVIMSVIQNFLFIIYPFQIIEFLDGFNVIPRQRQKLKVIYLRDWINTDSSSAQFISYLSFIILSIIALILIFNDKSRIQEKFGYFSIAYILFGFQFYHTVVSLVLFSLALLLFIPYLNQDKKRIEFVKSNKILLLGVFSILGIFFIAHEFILYEFIPIPHEYPLVILDNLRWIFLISIMIISLIHLKLKYKKISLEV